MIKTKVKTIFNCVNWYSRNENVFHINLSNSDKKWILKTVYGNFRTLFLIIPVSHHKQLIIKNGTFWKLHVFFLLSEFKNKAKSSIIVIEGK